MFPGRLFMSLTWLKALSPLSRARSVVIVTLKLAFMLSQSKIYLYVLMTLTMARWIRFQFGVTELKQTITRFPNQSLMIRNQSHRDGSDYFDVIKCSARTFPNGSRYLSAVDFFCSFIFFFLCFVFSYSFGVRVSCTRNLSRGINISHYLVNRFVSQATKRVREATHWKLNWSWDVSEKWRLKSTTITDSLRSHRKKTTNCFFFRTHKLHLNSQRFFHFIIFFLRPFSKCLASPYKYTVHYFFFGISNSFFLPSLAHFNMLYLFSTLYEEQLLARDKLFKLSSSIRLGSE